MRFFIPPSIPEATVDRMRSLKESGIDREILIARMRATGLSIIECIKLTRDLYNVGADEAKHIVHFSKAWTDMRIPAEDLHEDLMAEAKEDGWMVEEKSSAEEKQAATAA